MSRLWWAAALAGDEDAEVIAKILAHLGLPVGPPEPSPARNSNWLPEFSAGPEWTSLNGGWRWSAPAVTQVPSLTVLHGPQYACRRQDSDDSKE